MAGACITILLKAVIIKLKYLKHWVGTRKDRPVEQTEKFRNRLSSSIQPIINKQHFKSFQFSKSVGKFVYHFEITKLDSYLILQTKTTSRQSKKLNVKNETTKEPDMTPKYITLIIKLDRFGYKLLNHRQETISKIQDVNLKGKLQTCKTFRSTCG